MGTSRTAGSGWRSIAVVGVLATLTACSPGPTLPPPSATTPGTTDSLPSVAATSPLPATSPTPSAPPSVPPAAKRLCFAGQSVCALAAGRYSTAPSSAAFDFTAPGGWSNDQLDPGGGEIFTADASIFWLVDPHGGDQFAQEIKIAKTTAAVVKYLQGLKGTTSATPLDTAVGGLPATQIDVTSTVRNNFVFIAGHVGLGIHATTKARFLVIQRPGLVVVIVISTDRPQDFDALITTTQPIVDSISWE